MRVNQVELRSGECHCGPDLCGIWRPSLVLVMCGVCEFCVFQWYVANFVWVRTFSYFPSMLRGL